MHKVWMIMNELGDSPEDIGTREETDTVHVVNRSELNDIWKEKWNKKYVVFFLYQAKEQWRKNTINFSSFMSII